VVGRRRAGQAEGGQAALALHFVGNRGREIRIRIRIRIRIKIRIRRALVRRFVDHRARPCARLPVEGGVPRLMQLGGIARRGGSGDEAIPAPGGVPVNGLGQLGARVSLGDGLCTGGPSPVRGGRTVGANVGCFRPSLGGPPLECGVGRLAGKTRPKGQCAKGDEGDKETCRFHIDSTRIEVAVGVGGYCRHPRPETPFSRPAPRPKA